MKTTTTKVYNDAGSVNVWIWTGLRKLLDFTDWERHEPNDKGDCAALKTSDGKWFAEDCSAQKNFVCSVPKEVHVCDDEWIYFPYTAKCYKVFYHSDWNTAESNCVALGAHLVSIHYMEENFFIQGIAQVGFPLNDGEWPQAVAIGLYSSPNNNSEWLWTDGSTVDYFSWLPNQPDNPGLETCGTMITDQMADKQPSHWNNYICSVQMRNYVCKKQPNVIDIV
uniref:C-type lectin domain-containing protein n=1 Tax=Panagrolaimus sp. JU765 TaxID=591449 RepID=A0AC34PV35_9BILA